MKPREKIFLYGILIVVSLVVSLPACSQEEQSTDESQPRISGTQMIDVPQVSVTQIEQIRQKVRESELGEFPKVMWSTVDWLEDSTRIVVHIRMDGFEDPELQDTFCELAGELIRSGLLPGQYFDLYIIYADDVHRCR